MFFLILFIFSISNVIAAENKPKLTDYKKNVFSQWGEDGIIEKIFETIGTTSKVVVEFGAHDGFGCSNTAHLWTRDPAWFGILIEADSKLFHKLVANVAPYHCLPIHRMVGIGQNDSLEAILRDYNITTTIDLLSIDIDGDDYHVFKSLSTLRPRVIICEYNPSIPAHFDIHTRYGGMVGCSVAALERIALEKGYRLIAITDTNCFFVLNEEFHKFASFDTDREHLKINRYIGYLISDYCCNYKLIGETDFRDPWGWGGKPSKEVFYGEFKAIPAVIQR